VNYQLKQYQKQGNPGSLVGFLRNQGIDTNLLIINMMVSYNGGDYIDLVGQAAKVDFGNTQFSRVGITVQYKEGMLEIFGAFI
jgi:hypothetical protein